MTKNRYTCDVCVCVIALKKKKKVVTHSSSICALSTALSNFFVICSLFHPTLIKPLNCSYTARTASLALGIHLHNKGLFQWNILLLSLSVGVMAGNLGFQRVNNVFWLFWCMHIWRESGGFLSDIFLTDAGYETVQLPAQQQLACNLSF